ncbi:potassium-transporting ATPase subunit F [Nocardia sp. IFM 10818]
MRSTERGSRDVRRGVHRADSGDLRPARPDPTRGGTAVIQNIVGLVLAIGIAAFMVAALLFPERF